jgi:hypothetical protein
MYVVFKYNNCGTWTECAVCHEHERADVGMEPFLEGTWDWVCFECLEKVLPGGQRALEVIRAADAEREEREHLLSGPAGGDAFPF